MKKQPFNRIYTTIKNIDDVRNMEGLIASGRYGSKSEIIAKCVEIALPLLLNGKASLQARENDVEKTTLETVKRQGAILRDMSVITNITFNLVSSLFAERGLNLDGVRTNGADLRGGMYEQLPEHYQAILDELLK